jgi:hypothetical protein
MRTELGILLLLFFPEIVLGNNHFTNILRDKKECQSVSVTPLRRFLTITTSEYTMSLLVAMLVKIISSHEFRTETDMIRLSVCYDGEQNTGIESFIIADGFCIGIDDTFAFREKPQKKGNSDTEFGSSGV